MVTKFEKISNLEELRRYCNQNTISIAAEKLGVDSSKIKRVKSSFLNGKTNLNKIKESFKLDGKEFDEFINKEIKEYQEKENFDDEYEEEYEYRPYFRNKPDIPKEIKQKNERLIRDLKDKRDDFCGIGTNKAKRRLNKLSLTSDIAKAVRLAIEIEDKSISAKKAYGKFRQKIYDSKTKLIYQLSEVFKNNLWKYGVHDDKDDTTPTTDIIFFEIPGCEQISWHFTPFNNMSFQKYDGVWDGIKESTFKKLEIITKKLLENNLKP